jgi:hypothetical protein
VFVMKPWTSATVAPSAVAASLNVSAEAPKLSSQPSQPWCPASM